MTATPNRKLAAILAADVVGYSRLIAEDEARTLDALRALRRELFEPLVAEHRGEVVKRMGDGWLVSFGSVVDAAACAIQVQERLAGHDRIKLRIGVHLGDIVHEDEDIYGDGVNIAARLQEVAEPGGVMISGTAYESVIGRLDDHFQDGGERQLKNIQRPVRTWSWPNDGDDANPAANSFQQAEVSIASKRPSIAVMPFANLSSDAEQQYFADGMTEDVINALSRFRWLFVIARGTMFTYKGQSKSAAEIAAALDVRYVLEASVRQAGGKIRVSAQLIDTATGNHVWNERFDRALDDIFAIQDEITNTITRAIAPEIERAERSRAKQATPHEIDTWLMYHKALSVRDQVGVGKPYDVLEAMDGVLARDPNFIPALAFAAYTRATLAQSALAYDFEFLIAKASELADRALSLDRVDSMALWASARVKIAKGAFADAIQLANEGVRQNPNHLGCFQCLALAHNRSGHPELSLQYLDRAIEASPLNPDLPSVMSVRAGSYYRLGMWAETAATARQGLQYGGATSHRIWMRILGAVGAQKSGDAEAAREAIDSLLTENPDFNLAFIDKAFRNDSEEWVGALKASLRELGLPEDPTHQ